jgi:hypothetical protein
MKYFNSSTLNSNGFVNSPLFELVSLVVLALLSGFIARIPLSFDIDADWFYPRNISFVALPSMAAYFMVRSGLEWKRGIGVAAVFILSALYINLLPGDDSSDTLVLAFIHLPLFLWAVSGYVFVGMKHDDAKSISEVERATEVRRKNISEIVDEVKRRYKGERVSSFLRFNGDLAVISAVIVIAGGILSAITIGLFDLIDLDIEDFYFEYFAIWGLAAVPVVGAYLVLNNPRMVGSVSPVIARIFTPLVLFMLLVYLGAMVFTGKDPYNDREFLLVFNVLLIGVMALILFSVSEFRDRGSSSKKVQRGFSMGVLLLFVLSVVTVVTNGIALSAILFRISEWGFSPNRIAVLGSNLLVLANMVMVAHRLFYCVNQRERVDEVQSVIARFMPYYALWTFIVTFILPVVYQFS